MRLPIKRPLKLFILPGIYAMLVCVGQYVTMHAAWDLGYLEKNSLSCHTYALLNLICFLMFLGLVVIDPGHIQSLAESPHKVAEKEIDSTNRAQSFSKQPLKNPEIVNNQSLRQSDLSSNLAGAASKRNIMEHQEFIDGDKAEAQLSPGPLSRQCQGAPVQNTQADQNYCQVSEECCEQNEDVHRQGNKNNTENMRSRPDNYAEIEIDVVEDQIVKDEKFIKEKAIVCTQPESHHEGNQKLEKPSHLLRGEVDANGANQNSQRPLQNKAVYTSAATEEDNNLEERGPAHINIHRINSTPEKPKLKSTIDRNTQMEPPMNTTPRKEDSDRAPKPSEQKPKEGSDGFQLRFCLVCMVDQPLRSKHCNYCKVCVAMYDHHCPWVGNCIGERNKFLFYLFLITQLIIVLVLGFLNVAYQIYNFKGLLDLNWGMVLMLIIEMYFLVLLAYLVVLHTFLAMNNLTTWELECWNKITYLQNRPKSEGSPFSMGLYMNWKFFCALRICSRTFTEWKLTNAMNA